MTERHRSFTSGVMHASTRENNVSALNRWVEDTYHPNTTTCGSPERDRGQIVLTLGRICATS